jgi:hypothetical protein
MWKIDQICEKKTSVFHEKFENRQIRSSKPESEKPEKTVLLISSSIVHNDPMMLKPCFLRVSEHADSRKCPDDNDNEREIEISHRVLHILFVFVYWIIIW